MKSNICTIAEKKEVRQYLKNVVDDYRRRLDDAELRLAKFDDEIFDIEMRAMEFIGKNYN